MDTTENFGVKIAVGRIRSGGDTGLSTNLDAGVLCQLKRLDSKGVVDRLQDEDWIGAQTVRGRVHCCSVSAVCHFKERIASCGW